MLSNVAEIDVENDDVVLMFSKLVQISVKIDINLVNSDLPKVFSTFVWRFPMSQRHINLTTMLKHCYYYCCHFYSVYVTGQKYNLHKNRLFKSNFIYVLNSGNRKQGWRRLQGQCVHFQDFSYSANCARVSEFSTSKRTMFHIFGPRHLRAFKQQSTVFMDPNCKSVCERRLYSIFLCSRISYIIGAARFLLFYTAQLYLIQ